MIFLEAKGRYACFTKAEAKVERQSQEIITPSAARGLIESVFWHPGMVWRIDKIFVLNPIRFMNVRRNEVESKISARNVRAVMNGKAKSLYIATPEDIQQRAALILTDVKYIIKCHFDMTERANATDNEGKFQSIVKRRLRKGQCYHQGYLGCREFPAELSLYEGREEDIVTAEELRDQEIDLGYMLYDMDYSDKRDIKPVFFHAILRNGVLDVKDCGVEVCYCKP